MHQFEEYDGVNPGLSFIRGGVGMHSCHKLSSSASGSGSRQAFFITKSTRFDRHDYGKITLNTVDHLMMLIRL